MIESKGLSKVYRTEEVETTAINQLNMKIDAGEFVSIMGDSGCGKSTLLNLIGLLDSPSSGQLIFDGIDVSRMDERARAAIRKQNIGFIFQSFNLIDELSVFENVELPLVYLGMSKSERKDRVLEVLQRVAIDHRRNHRPQQLSGGQQQRVAIARAVVAGPKLLLADEPTGNLDSRNGEDVLGLMTELNTEGATIVMVTHSEHDAGFSRRTLRLSDGMLEGETIHQH